ncbi:GT-D fold domain-containing glycosyltransferase [Cohnella sp. GCM10027633]|uniref:GT-D fold domain-containing protein n=1 Tax=unclassified Cohnella TaxID=2636738 RepID=UPI00362969FD
MKAVIMAVRTARQTRRLRSRVRVRRAGKHRRAHRHHAARAQRKKATGLSWSEAGPGYETSAGTEYELGYRRGMVDGAEKLLEHHLPADRIIPDVTADEAMAAGVQALRIRSLPLIGIDRVFEELDGAARERRPYSFIRLGDGELMTLAQEVVMPVSELRTSSPFLPYAGIVVPDLSARDRLAEAIRSATLVGVPVSRQPQYQPLLFRVLHAHGIPCANLSLTTSTMNYSLYEHDCLPRLLGGRKLLLVGNVANELAMAFKAQGYHVAGVVSPVKGFGDVDRVVAESAAHDFDFALVSAGIPAIPIVVGLAARTGKVAIDFGHLADRIAGVKTRISSLSSDEG